MYFCPVCGNLLTINKSNSFEFLCLACPYKAPVEKPVTAKAYFKRKEEDDVLGGEEAWENVQATEVNCPVKGCGGERAYFFQLQIRSADEPMTTFYKCAKCQTQWKEN